MKRKKFKRPKCLIFVTYKNKNERKKIKINSKITSTIEKKLEFFNKTWIKYEFFTIKNIEIHI